VFANTVRHVRQEQQPTAEQQVMLTGAAVEAGAALRQLEPNNPKSHSGAALALNLGGGSQQQIFESHMRSFELGQQQGSDFYTCSGACMALNEAAFAPLEVGHRALASALAAFEQTAEAALRRCKRLLPEEWVRHLERQAERARTLVPGAREQLRLLQQQASGTAAAREALGTSVAAQVAAVGTREQSVGGQHRQFPHDIDCDGCGKPAVGLRRCSRCQPAQYCRCARMCSN
jgi:hypothetical protein